MASSSSSLYLSRVRVKLSNLRRISCRCHVVPTLEFGKICRVRVIEAPGLKGHLTMNHYETQPYFHPLSLSPLNLPYHLSHLKQHPYYLKRPHDKITKKRCKLCYYSNHIITIKALRQSNLLLTLNPFEIR